MLWTICYCVPNKNPISDALLLFSAASIEVFIEFLPDVISPFEQFVLSRSLQFQFQIKFGVDSFEFSATVQIRSCQAMWNKIVYF